MSSATRASPSSDASFRVDIGARLASNRRDRADGETATNGGTVGSSDATIEATDDGNASVRDVSGSIPENATADSTTLETRDSSDRPPLLVLIGDRRAGKTTLALRIVARARTCEYIPTLESVYALSHSSRRRYSRDGATSATDSASIGSTDSFASAPTTGRGLDAATFALVDTSGDLFRDGDESIGVPGRSFVAGHRPDLNAYISLARAVVVVYDPTIYATVTSALIAHRAVRRTRGEDFPMLMIENDNSSRDGYRGRSASRNSLGSLLRDGRTRFARVDLRNASGDVVRSTFARELLDVLSRDSDSTSLDVDRFSPTNASPRRATRDATFVDRRDLATSLVLADDPFVDSRLWLRRRRRAEATSRVVAARARARPPSVVSCGVVERRAISRASLGLASLERAERPERGRGSEALSSRELETSRAANSSSSARTSALDRRRGNARVARRDGPFARFVRRCSVLLSSTGRNAERE